jgi:hypothetical protein
MKPTILALACAIFCTVASVAAKSTPVAGRIISEKSVECGTKNNGKKSSIAILCQQYAVQTVTTEYQIRQPKPTPETIIPANTAIQFTIDKDKMKFKLNGKNYEFVIVGTSAITTPDNDPQ